MAADVRNQIGERLRALRKQRGWTQVTMADLVGMSRTYLALLETGHKDPSLSMLRRIADCLEMTLSKLLEPLR